MEKLRKEAKIKGWKRREYYATPEEHEIMAATTSQRVNKTRQAKRERGLVKVEVWVRPEHKQTVKALEKELNKDNQA